MQNLDLGFRLHLDKVRFQQRLQKIRRFLQDLLLLLLLHLLRQQGENSSS